MSRPELIAAVGIAFAIGAILFGIGRTIVASRERAFVREPAAQITWTSLIAATDEPLDAAARIEMIERLALLGEPWCVELLRAARTEERDPAVASALRRALGLERSQPAAR